jgi:hypothetical protein
LVYGDTIKFDYLKVAYASPTGFSRMTVYEGVEANVDQDTQLRRVLFTMERSLYDATVIERLYRAFTLCILSSSYTGNKNLEVEVRVGAALINMRGQETPLLHG